MSADRTTRPPLTIHIDCTSIAATDLNTGIQRVERNLITAMQAVAREHGVEVVPVHCYDGRRFARFDHVNFKAMLYESGYLHRVRFHTRQFRRFRRLVAAVFPFDPFHAWLERHWQGWRRWGWTAPLMLAAAPVVLASMLHGLVVKPPGYWRPRPGDVFFVPGSSWWDFPGVQRFISRVKRRGGRLAVLIHDLFPVTRPELVDEGNIRRFAEALPAVLGHADLVIANSASTRAEIADYLRRQAIAVTPRLAFAHLGVDNASLTAGNGVRDGIRELFTPPGAVYLCVGTIEPRKNHTYLLDAFDRLWAAQSKTCLCLIGRYGWLSEQFLARLRGHARWGRQLFWFDDATDQELAFCYRNAGALIFPSVAEGFGLPLIEALRQGCPVMASDIPVFREIGGEHCAYFSLRDPGSLTRLVQACDATGRLPGVTTVPFEWPGWRQAAQRYLAILVDAFAHPDQPAARG